MTTQTYTALDGTTRRMPASVARARALIDESMDHIQARHDESYKRLAGYNGQLLDLHIKIRAAQSLGKPAVSLDLNKCGTSCTGCPHPVWAKYTWPDEANPGTFIKNCRPMGTILKAGASPAAHLAKGNPHYQEALVHIRQACHIIELRQRLLKAESNLGHTLRYQPYPRVLMSS